jgi:hypothetical protein
MPEHIVRFHRDNGHVEVVNMRYFMFMDRDGDHFRVVFFSERGWTDKLSPAEADRFLAAIEESTTEEKGLSGR